MFNFQAFVSTFILAGLFLMACLSAHVSVNHRWWPFKVVALLASITFFSLMVAHIVYLFAGV